MRVIIATGLNSGTAEYLNMGDIAMLQVAVARLRALWPSAHIEVLTDSAVELARFCPDVTSLSRSACLRWAEGKRPLGRYHQLLPEWVSSRVVALEKSVRLRWPLLIELLIRLKLGLRGRYGQLHAFKVFLRAFKQADLLIVCGSGGFSDTCKQWNLATLSTIEAAVRIGIPVALLGQGMGPLTDPIVLAKARSVLPAVAFVALRGNRGALPLLASIGVDAAKVVITGDDAVGLAYAARTDEAGTAVGINLRVASYAEVKEDVIDSVRAVLQQFARKHDVDLLPVPIALHDHARDHETIRRLLKGFDDESDGGLHLDSPMKLIEQVARCRIVVTGAFHAAVFALAQGIPAICLSSSSFYDSKFQGLIDFFGSGCAIISPSDAEFRVKLAEAMERMYELADSLRAPLLEAAHSQADKSDNAYQKIRRALSSTSGEINHSVAAALSR